MTPKIISASVVVRLGFADSVLLVFDLPDAISTDEKLAVSFRAPYSTGREYVRRNFRVVPEMIRPDTEQQRFSRGTDR